MLVTAPSADMFSLGMLLLELSTRLQLPTEGVHWRELRTGNLSGMEQCSNACWFELKPEHRASNVRFDTYCSCAGQGEL